MRKLSVSLIGLGSLLVAFSIAVWAAGLGIHEHRGAPAYEIAFIQDREAGYEGALYVARKDGSGLRRVKEAGRASALLWSPGGRWLAYSRSAPHSSEIYLVNATFTKVRRLTRLGGYNIAESWSRDGKRLLIRRLDRSHGTRCYCCCEPCSCFYRYIVDVTERGTAHSLPARVAEVSQNGAPSFAAWTQDGTLLLSGRNGSAIYAVKRDLSIIRLTTKRRQWFFSGTSASSSGRLLVAGNDKSSWLMTNKGKIIRRIPGEYGQISPDGRFVAYNCRGVCVMKLSDRRVRRVLGRDFSSVDIIWSPNSHSIAASDGLGPELIVKTDGSGSHHLALVQELNSEFQSILDWSPDSRLIAFLAEAETASPLYVAATDGQSDPVRISGKGKVAVNDFAWRPVLSNS